MDINVIKKMYSQDDSVGGRSIYHTIRMIHEDTGASACVDLMLDQHRLNMYSFLGISQIRLTIDVQTTSEMLSQHPVPVRHVLFGIVSNVSLTMAERRSATGTGSAAAHCSFHWRLSICVAVF